MKTCDQIQFSTPEDQCKIFLQFINPRIILLPHCPEYSHQRRCWRTTVDPRPYTGATDVKSQNEWVQRCFDYREGNKQDLSIFKYFLQNNETIFKKKKEKGGKHVKTIFWCCHCAIYKIQCYFLCSDTELRI